MFKIFSLNLLLCNQIRQFISYLFMQIITNHYDLLLCSVDINQYTACQ